MWLKKHLRVRKSTFSYVGIPRKIIPGAEPTDGSAHSIHLLQGPITQGHTET
jgi:hypothetical protein